MLSSLFRPKTSPQILENSFSTHYSRHRHATADWTETEGDDSEEEGHGEADDEEHQEVDHGLMQEDGEETPLLPIFSAAHLDTLPVYHLTHAIRLIILPRTETTLTWDQLRSPQVSQFLIKPMQQQIRKSHFSRATLYALMANCLQFQKECQSNPGNAGTSRTRALVCELLAIKLLREYNTRELIDSLSYDFFPLQGVADGQGWEQRNRPAAARISTFEIAIRASAKYFLAHPLVVQQLEAIWAGTIVFQSHSDALYRKSSGLDADNQQKDNIPVHRRIVILYDPRDASLFKLSRLRVPRYRQFFSTCSLAILLALFVAVLSKRSTAITTLEVVFWFWSAGFMLDEVVGFNEQGFSLYIMSFWNAFDLGILFLLMVYYAMRLWGIFLVGSGRLEWNSMAYDVLATNAILLFPRLFSVLDHYRYFSQLLIAFRLMAVDLVAVFVLILIACSGFFVAFTFSFNQEYDAPEIAYKFFQILMGFTPAAWETWPTYNPLGKALLVLFLIICHFLAVTILITVLTNSFMAIVSNAEQEHQFVFAVNTISMVKNDELFSYVAPSNIFAWGLTPLRFVLPFRSFVQLNRMVIKLTHFPLLFGIYIYESLFLASSVFEPTDLVDRKVFSPRLRHDSISEFKDMALEEVFRLAPRQPLQTHNVVHSWMEHMSPPNQNMRRSAVSDPLDFTFQNEQAVDGDDELNTHDGGTIERESHATSSESESYFVTPTAKVKNRFSTSGSPAKTTPRRTHNRNMSTNTIVYNPVSSPRPITAGVRTPLYSKSQPRPVLPSRSTFQMTPRIRRRSSLDMSISEGQGIPNSFATEMALATGGLKGDGMMGRLMLARMKTLEEGFADVVKEFRGLSSSMRTTGSGDIGGSNGKGKRKRKSMGMATSLGTGVGRTTSEVDFARVGTRRDGRNLQVDDTQGAKGSSF